MVSPKPDEGNDLRQSGQCGVKAFNLALVRGAAVADHNAGNEDGEEAGSVQQRRYAVQKKDAREGSQRVQGLARKRDAAHEPEQSDTARNASGHPDRHLQQEFDSNVAEGDSSHSTSGQQPTHQRDPDGVVRSGFALQDRAAASGDLLLPENREHHCRVGRRDGSRDQQRDIPGQPEGRMHQEAAGSRGQEGAEYADDDDQSERRPEPSPADVPATVEEDQHQRNCDDLLDRIVLRCWHSRNNLHGDRGSDQHPDRCRNSESRRQPVDQDRRERNCAGQRDDPGVLGRLGHVLLLGGVDEAGRLPTSLPRHTEAHTTPPKPVAGCQRNGRRPPSSRTRSAVEGRNSRAARLCSAATRRNCSATIGSSSAVR